MNDCRFGVSPVIYPDADPDPDPDPDPEAMKPILTKFHI